MPASSRDALQLRSDATSGRGGAIRCAPVAAGRRVGRRVLVPDLECRQSEPKPISGLQMRPAHLAAVDERAVARAKILDHHGPPELVNSAVTAADPLIVDGDLDVLASAKDTGKAWKHNFQVAGVGRARKQGNSRCHKLGAG